MNSPNMKLSTFTKKARDNSKLTLIFVHGNSQSPAIWQHQLNATELRHFNLVTIVLPGHGQSPRMKNYSITKITGMLVEKINKEQDYILVGHSLGGHFCIEALPKLNNCLGLLLCGTPPLKKPLNIDEAFNNDERMALLFQGNLNNGELDDLANFISSAEDNTLIKSLIRQSDGKFRNDLGIAVGKGELLDEVDILTMTKLPIAFVLGELDGLINKLYMENIVMDIDKNIRIHSVSKSGHSPHFENPAAFNKILFEFANSLQQS